jgi:maleate cis-trans isomerase
MRRDIKVGLVIPCTNATMEVKFNRALIPYKPNHGNFVRNGTIPRRRNVSLEHDRYRCRVLRVYKWEFIRRPWVG